jgi:hypothetical protein
MGVLGGIVATGCAELRFAPPGAAVAAPELPTFDVAVGPDAAGACTVEVAAPPDAEGSSANASETHPRATTAAKRVNVAVLQ